MGVAKLQKEKRGVAESRQKTEEDIQSMEDKCNHLNKVKGKLEQALDECEDSLEREKKTKGDVEKLKRKVEGDLKLTQEAVSDLERVRSELSQTIQRKEKEISSMSAKIDDEGTLGSKYSKQVKELQGRLEELDEELAIERQSRAKAEKNRATLSRDIEDLASKLEDAGNSTATQIELNKKREAELAKLKAELEESNIAHEGTLAALRQKHNNNMNEMGEQIDSLNKMKAKSEKDKANLRKTSLMRPTKNWMRWLEHLMKQTPQERSCRLRTKTSHAKLMKQKLPLLLLEKIRFLLPLN